MSEDKGLPLTAPGGHIMSTEERRCLGGPDADAPVLDLTGYSWRITRDNPYQLRLDYYTAPGWAKELCRRLQELGVRYCRVHSGGSVRVTESESLVNAAALLGASEGVLTALREYDLAVRAAPPFTAPTPEARAGRRAAAARVAALCPRGEAR